MKLENRDLRELLTKHIKYSKSGGKMCRRSKSDEKRLMHCVLSGDMG